MENKSHRNDAVESFVGPVMLVIGGYLFMQNVQVTTFSIFAFSIGGRRMDGVIFLPLIASIIYLFYKYNLASKICCILSIIIIIVNVIVNLELYWSATSLFSTIIIFVLLFGGAALVARVIFANPGGKHGKKY